MRHLSLLAVLLLLVGCAPDESPDAPANDLEMNDEYDRAAEWHADLQGLPGFEDVSGSAHARVEDGRTNVTASVSGAPPEGTHPWHIHNGSCETGGGIVGDAGAYPPLQVGAEGNASAEATIAVGLDEGAQYHVNVHASPEDLGTVVACGDLRAN